MVILYDIYTLFVGRCKNNIIEAIYFFIVISSCTVIFPVGKLSLFTHNVAFRVTIEKNNIHVSCNIFCSIDVQIHNILRSRFILLSL